jgi:hypothetical protein
MPNVLLNPELAKRKLRVMAIDPAVKNDAFGVAVGYRDVDDRVIVDGAIKFRRLDGDPIIKPSMIREYLNKHMMILGVHTLVTDVWMYPDIIEMAQMKGVNVVQHIVKKEDYDLIKSLISSNKLDIVYDQELKLEFDQLEVKGGVKPRVDHPLSGGKDSADCVANVVWHLNNNDLPSMNLGYAPMRTF